MHQGLKRLEQEHHADTSENHRFRGEILNLIDGIDKEARQTSKYEGAEWNHKDA